jgi:hypothetical protein
MEAESKLEFEYSRGRGSQYDVLEYLRANPGSRLSANQIATGLGAAPDTIRGKLSRLFPLLIDKEIRKRKGKNPENYYWPK